MFVIIFKEEHYAGAPHDCCCNLQQLRETWEDSQYQNYFVIAVIIL